MDIERLYDLSHWITYPISVLTMFGAAQVGRRLGRGVRARRPGADAGQIKTFESCLLGLLAFMIGFTFSLANAQLEAGKAVVVGEANAVRTAALRASLLSEPQSAEATRLLRAYVDTRIALAAAGGAPSRTGRAVDDASLLQGRLRVQAAAALAVSAPAVVNPFVQSLGEIGEFHAKRLAADRNHVPEAAFVLLYLIAVVALGFVGYESGLEGSPNLVPTAILVLAIATVILLVTDLDQRHAGFVVVSQQPMVDLREDLARQPTPRGSGP